MGLVRASAPSEAPRPLPTLDDPDPGQRRLALRALGAGSEGLLLDHLARETDASLREACLLALIDLATPEAAEGLARLLSSEEAALRNGALESLAALPAQSAALLDRMAGSDDPDVRIFAAILAGELGLDWIEDWLIDLLSRDDDANVCAAICEVLAEAGSEDALPALQEIPARFPDEPFLHFVAATVTSRLGGSP